MAAAAVTNMKKKVRDCKMFWESLAHQWAANYFLVRMVVPGTKPVENPCSIGWYNKIPFMEESSGASLPPACSMKLCLRTLMSFAIHFQATKKNFFAGVSVAQHEHWVSFIYVFTFHS